MTASRFDMADIIEDEIHYQPIEEQCSEQRSLAETVECPNCSTSFALQERTESRTNPISCPLCQRIGLKSCDELLRHLRVVHAKGEKKRSSREPGRKKSLIAAAGLEKERWNKVYKAIHDRKRLPKQGDQVLAMWAESKWEYFGATVSRFDTDSMMYVVKWIHEEGAEGNISVEDIALDEILDDDDIGVGTLVLFRQGNYTSSHKQKDRNRGARRWHQGIITHVNKTEDGSKTYSGHHTRTDTDGKFIKYQRYSYTFTNLTKFAFRLAPNIFDVLLFSSQADNTLEESDTPTMETDVYLSYDIIDSAHGIDANKVDVGLIPESYKNFGYDRMCDPVSIEEFLKLEGLAVCKHVYSKEGKQDVKKVASMIKHSKVFIACLSDKYVSNTKCCMEFQHAKVSLKKPVIPLVVGDGSFKWMTSLVGMLIAGELFIHYRDKDVESNKNAELLMNVRNHIPEVVVEKENESFTKPEGQQWDYEDSRPIEEITKTLTPMKTKALPEIFLSYCWSNSHSAHEEKQIESFNGTIFSDPRLLKEKLERAGYEVWLDIERLESANADAGLFGQIVQGIKSSLLVIPCVSDEYANSQNCTMEFQFSVKSLSKPVVPVVVGTGEDWKLSVIGCLLSTNDKDPINIQEVSDEKELEEKVSQIICEIENIIGKPRKEVMRKVSRAMSYSIALGSTSSSPSSSPSSESSSDSDNEEIGAIKARTSEKIKPCSIPLPPPRLRAPKIKDRVIGHYSNLLFSAGTVVGVNARNLTYTVDWDSEELEQVSVVPYDQVALDEPIERDDIGVGMDILFPQGDYFCNTCDENHLRYFEGEITAIIEGVIDEEGNMSSTLLSGRRLRPSFMGYLLDSSAYNHYFDNVNLNDVRLPPTAFDFMEMCVNEEDEDNDKKMKHSRSFSLF